MIGDIFVDNVSLYSLIMLSCSSVFIVVSSDVAEVFGALSEVGGLGPLVVSFPVGGP